MNIYSHKSPRCFLTRQGFDLAEVMIVLTTFSIIAAIIIPNIDSIRNSAHHGSTQRNAQSVVSVLTAAQAAGVDLTAAGVKDPATAVEIAAKGVFAPSPTGEGTGKKYSVEGLLPDPAQIVTETAAFIRVQPGDDHKVFISFTPEEGL